MIEAGPDVEHTFLEVIHELFDRRQCGQREPLFRRIDAQDACAALAVRREIEEPAMLRIDVEEQPVAHFQHPGRGRAVRSETQHGIGAIAVIIDKMLANGRHDIAMRTVPA